MDIQRRFQLVALAVIAIGAFALFPATPGGACGPCMDYNVCALNPPLNSCLGGDISYAHYCGGVCQAQAGCGNCGFCELGQLNNSCITAGAAACEQFNVATIFCNCIPNPDH